jgi:hypothetical protein
MNTTLEFKPKSTWRERVAAEFAKLMALAETRGFYGTASLVLTVQDGALQHFRIIVDRQLKDD